MKTARDVMRALADEDALPPALAALVRQFGVLPAPQPQLAPVKRDFSFKPFDGSF